MEAVLGLVEDDRMRSVHNGTGRFVVPVRGQEMHEKGVGFGARHQFLVNLSGAQPVVAAFLGGLRVVHRDPGVADDGIGGFDGMFAIMVNQDVATLRPREDEDGGIKIQQFNAIKGAIKTELRGGMGRCCGGRQ